MNSQKVSIKKNNNNKQKIAISIFPFPGSFPAVLHLFEYTYSYTYRDSGMRTATFAVNHFQFREQLRELADQLQR